MRVWTSIDHVMLVIPLNTHRYFEERIHNTGPGKERPSTDVDDQTSHHRNPQRTQLADVRSKIAYCDE